jgi:hypothetical protein
MIAYIATAAISVSAGVLGMGMWCGRKHMTTLSERDRARIDYATERRKRLEAEQARDEIDIACKHWMSENTQLHARLKEAEQAHTDLADKHNCTNARIENVITLIDSIPHRKGKETLIKAILRGEA